MAIEKFILADDDLSTIGPRLEINFVSKKQFSGANRYHGSSVIAYELDLGIFAGVRTSELPPEFADAFLERFRSLPSFLPDNGVSKRFEAVLRSKAGIDLAQVLLEAVLAVEHSVSFAQHDLGSVSFAAIDGDGDQPLLVWETSRPEISSR